MVAFIQVTQLSEDGKTTFPQIIDVTVIERVAVEDGECLLYFKQKGQDKTGSIDLSIKLKTPFERVIEKLKKLNIPIE